VYNSTCLCSRKTSAKQNWCTRTPGIAGCGNRQFFWAETDLGAVVVREGFTEEAEVAAPSLSHL